MIIQRLLAYVLLISIVIRVVVIVIYIYIISQNGCQVEANAFHLCSALSACTRASRWSEALRRPADTALGNVVLRAVAEPGREGLRVR